MFARLRKRWVRMWQRAPRRLTVTREGKIVLLITMAIGFAAINTGNNLLFLGWGLMLSAIVFSGILSESTLRSTRLRVEHLADKADQARVNLALPIQVTTENISAYVPSFALRVEVTLGTPAPATEAVPGPFVLRLSAGASFTGYVQTMPTRRGKYQVYGLTARTSFPFGFFDKDRRYAAATGGRTALAYWAAPEKVDVTYLSVSLMAQLGEESSHRVGLGDEFYSLRPYREGDDPRRIHWRRSARSGRRMVVETEAMATREVLLELPLPGGDASSEALVEYGLAALGSLAENLLGAGMRVGVLSAGTFVAPDTGPRQVRAMLQALARLDVRASAPVVDRGHNTAVVALCLPGVVAPAGSEVQLALRPPLGVAA